MVERRVISLHSSMEDFYILALCEVGRGWTILDCWKGDQRSSHHNQIWSRRQVILFDFAYLLQNKYIVVKSASKSVCFYIRNTVVLLFWKLTQLIYGIIVR